MQHSLSIPALFRKFPDDRSAERWFADTRWPDGPVCPHCASSNVQTKAKHPSQPYRCRACRKRFSVRTGTVMADSKLGYRIWALAIYLLLANRKSMSSLAFARTVGVSRKTAWFLAHRIRESFDDHPAPMTGIVEADESYIGGRFRSMHHRKREENRTKPHYGKTLVAGVRERTTGRFCADIIPDTSTESLHGFLARFTAPGTRIYTDEAPAYASLPNHASVQHGRGQYVCGDVSTNGVESLWATFKRADIGTWHCVSRKHLRRYLNECCGRLNLRGLTMVDQMAACARGDGGKAAAVQGVGRIERIRGGLAIPPRSLCGGGLAPTVASKPAGRGFDSLLLHHHRS